MDQLKNFKKNFIREQLIILFYQKIVCFLVEGNLKLSEKIGNNFCTLTKAMKTVALRYIPQSLIFKTIIYLPFTLK